MSRFHGVPSMNAGSTREVTFCILKLSSGKATRLTGTVIATRRGVRRYGVYHGLARSRVYPVYDGRGHSESAVYIIRDPHSIVTFRHARRCHNLCRILRNIVSPVGNVNPSSLAIGRLLLHVGSDMGRIVVTAGPAMRNRTATVCVDGLLGPVNVGMAELTCNIPMNTSLRCTSRMALVHTLRNEGLV